MLIPINTKLENIFHDYITIVNTILSSQKKLTSIEIDVLSNFLLIDYIYKELPKDKRDKILFAKVTKDKIRVNLKNMSTHSFNNILAKLRKKGFITKETLNVRVPIKNNQIELNFKLEIIE